MALADVKERGGGVADIVGEIVDHILIGGDGGVALVEFVEAAPHAQQDVGERLALGKLEGVGLVGGVGPLVVRLGEKLVGVLKVEPLEGIEFRKGITGIIHFLRMDARHAAKQDGHQPQRLHESERLGHWWKAVGIFKGAYRLHGAMPNFFRFLHFLPTYLRIDVAHLRQLACGGISSVRAARCSLIQV